MILIFLDQNICYGYSKTLSPEDGSFDHAKQVLKLTVRKYSQYNAFFLGV